MLVVLSFMHRMMEGLHEENEEEDDLMMANWLHAVNRTVNMPQYMRQEEYGEMLLFVNL